jgi:hypothetical protein
MQTAGPGEPAGCDSRAGPGYIKGPDFEVFFRCAEAILIADRGLTSDVEKLLDYVLTHSISRQKQNAEMFADWVRRKPRPTRNDESDILIL